MNKRPVRTYLELNKAFCRFKRHQKIDNKDDLDMQVATQFIYYNSEWFNNKYHCYKMLVEKLIDESIVNNLFCKYNRSTKLKMWKSFGTYLGASRLASNFSDSASS